MDQKQRQSLKDVFKKEVQKEVQKVLRELDKGAK